MAILVTRLATAVSSRKTPKMETNRDFPGLRAFSANVARDKIEEQEIPHPMVKSTARFGAPKIESWPFYLPGGPRPFQAEKHPKWQEIAISRGYVHFPELPISAHLACARVCRQLYVLCASHALVQATVGVGTVIIVYIGVAYTRGGVNGRSLTVMPTVCLSTQAVSSGC